MKSLICSKVSGDGGGSYPGRVTRPTRTEKLYKADLAIYVFHDGTVEVGKNRNGQCGNMDLNEVVFNFTRIISQIKLKETNLDMFKEGLHQLLYEAVQNVLKGNHNERTVCSKSTGNGSNSNRSP